MSSVFNAKGFWFGPSAGCFKWLGLICAGFFFNACALQYGSAYNAKVKVWVSPFGEGKELRPSSPYIFTNGATLPCRPAAPDPRRVRSFLENRNLLKNEGSPVFDLYGIDPKADEDNVPSETTRTPVKIDVEENWLEFGLQIANSNENEYLIVTGISFVAEARQWGQVFNHTGNVPVSYCDNSYKALYIVPPNIRLEYKPNSLNSLENLTIYLSGFPVVDTTEDTSLQATGGDAAAAAGAGSASQNAGARPGCGISIPRYRVRLILRGYFIRETGTRVSDFVHRTVFSTQPSFTGC